MGDVADLDAVGENQGHEGARRAFVDHRHRDRPDPGDLAGLPLNRRSVGFPEHHTPGEATAMHPRRDSGWQG